MEPELRMELKFGMEPEFGMQKDEKRGEEVQTRSRCDKSG